MIKRRTLIGAGLMGIAPPVLGGAHGQGMRAVPDGTGASREAAAIMQQYYKLNYATSDIRPAGAPTSLDLSDVIRDALNHEGDRKAALLAARAGLLLSELTRDQREPRDVDGITAAKPHPFNAKIKEYYSNLLNTVTLVDTRQAYLDSVAARIIAGKDRYSEVEGDTQIPWFIIGALHYREANLNFMGHLHNGDPLQLPTVHVPEDRPAAPWPPGHVSLRQLWRISAKDALGKIYYHSPKWSAQRACWVLEGYNGFGCYDHRINTPYLWNYTNHYQQGGYPSDGKFSKTYVSKQAGLLGVLTALARKDPDVKARLVPET